MDGRQIQQAGRQKAALYRQCSYAATVGATMLPLWYSYARSFIKVLYCRSTPIGLLQYLHWITPVLLQDYSSTSIRIHKSTASCFPAKPISPSTRQPISSSTSDNTYYQNMNIDKSCHNSSCEPTATGRRSKKRSRIYRMRTESLTTDSFFDLSF